MTMPLFFIGLIILPTSFSFIDFILAYNIFLHIYNYLKT